VSLLAHARVGTGSPGKSAAFAARVDSVSSTTRVRELHGVPGSLKAMWPLEPNPRNVSPNPPPPPMARS